MKLSQKLATELAEKREKVKALLAKDNASEAEIKEATDLVTEIETADAAYKNALRLDQFEEQNETALIDLKNTPVNPLPHSAQKSNVEFEGKDGEVVVDTKTRKILEESGFAIGEKQMADISTKTYRDAFVNMLRKKGEHNLGEGDRKSLASGTDSAGGFLVPAQFLAQMIERAPGMGMLSDQVTNLQTSSDKLVIPKNTYSASDKYTTGVRVEWTDEEDGATTEQNARNFGNITIPVHTAMMYHDVTNNMLEDSAFDILSWLQMRFGETSDVVQEDLIVNGDGVGKPAGILLNAGGTNAPAVVNSGNANLITADGLIDLAWTMPSRYNRNSRFVFNRTSAGRAIAKLKDNDNRYLFASGVQNDGLATARPESLLGYPISDNDFMPDVAANAFPVIFGDLKGYYKVQRVGFSIQILREIVATQNKVRLLGRMRIGGQVAEDWKLKIQKISA